MLSVIVVVKDDPKLSILLERLGVVVSKKDEVIVVDASEGRLDEIKNKFKKLKWVNYEGDGIPVSSIPQQRNMGLSLTKGDVIVFVDSDCRPEDDWLDNLAKPILSGKEDIVAGRVVFSNVNSAHEVEFSKKAKLEYLDEAPTMNLAVRKEVFEKIGMFDEKFPIGEDVDFCWRAGRAGYKIKYQYDAVIYHDLGTFRREVIRMYRYGVARVALYDKNGYRLKYFWGNEFLSLGYVLCAGLIPVMFLYPILGLAVSPWVVKDIYHSKGQNLVLKTIYGWGVLMGLFRYRFYLM